MKQPGYLCVRSLSDLTLSRRHIALVLGIASFVSLFGPGCSKRLSPAAANDALIAAAIKGDEAGVRKFLDEGGDANAKSSLGSPAIVAAAENVKQNAGVIELLLAGGAKANTVYKGMTTLQLAVSSGNVRGAASLIKHGADVNACTKDGVTALMIAGSHGYVESIGLLLSHKAKIDLVDRNGNSALMWAVLGGRSAAAHKLVSAGAKTKIRNHQGRMARDLAIVHKQPDLAHFLALH